MRTKESPLTFGYGRHLPEGFPKYDGTPPLTWRGVRPDEKAVSLVPDTRKDDPYYQYVLPVPVAILGLTSGPTVSLAGQFNIPSGSFTGERYNFVYDEMKGLVEDIWAGRIPLADGPAALEAIKARHADPGGG